VAKEIMSEAVDRDDERKSSDDRAIADESSNSKSKAVEHSVKKHYIERMWFAGTQRLYH
jgi:hypothetical protein